MTKESHNIYLLKSHRKILISIYHVQKNVIFNELTLDFYI